MQRICKTQKINNNALQYFLLSFILASTRAWNQFYNKKQGLLDFLNPSSLGILDILQEEMFDNPPEILYEPIDLSPMREILYKNIEILSVICQKKIIPNDIDKFMRFNKVQFFKFKDDGKENQAAYLMGLSTFDGEITYLNSNRQGQDLIDSYLHEFCHNFYRFMSKNNQPGCLSPINNKSLRIYKYEVQIRQQDADKRKLLKELESKDINLKDYFKKYNQINQRIITHNNSMVYVESGDFFDFHVLKKAINADPYSLLINLNMKN